MRIGWIGLGHMGAPMARNLHAAGFDVIGFDLSESARDDAGIPVAASAVDAARDADVLVTMLPAGAHVRAVLAESGALEASRPGSLVVDSSTIAVADTRAASDIVAAAGRTFVDAPVSGGTAGARNATLTFMVGGADDAVAAAGPLFGAMGARTFHAGPVGAGQSVKLLNNLMLAVNMQSTCEAAVLAGTLGVDPAALVEIAATCTGDSWVLRNYYPVDGVVESAPSSRGFRDGFAAQLMHKDLGLALDAADEAGLELPAVRLVRSRLDELMAGGDGGLDFSAVVGLLGARPAMATAGAL